MTEKTIKVGTDLDARKAAFFVQTANKFQSKVELSVDGRKINAKSIMGTISLGVVSGQQATIITDGADEAAAADELSKVLI